MPKAFPRALAHKFLVISTQSDFANCIGTKEQLISAGLALPHHFPQGRQRNYTATYYTVSRVKGGLFKWEGCQARKSYPEFNLPPVIQSFELYPMWDGRYCWNMQKTKPLDEEVESEIKSAAYRLLDLVSKARLKRVKRCFKVVKPIAATGGK